MSSTKSEYSANPEPNLTPAEIDDLNRLEAVAQRGIASYVQVGDALAEIRDRHLYRRNHPSFESYARERWDVSAGRDQLSQSIFRDEAAARACEQSLSALYDDERLVVEIRFAAPAQEGSGTLGDGRSIDGPEVAGPPGDELLPQLRWFLAEASGTIGEVSNQLENRAVEIDDHAREQLRADILLLDAELAVVKALLADLIDWDLELSRLLNDDLPPLDAESDIEDE